MDNHVVDVWWSDLRAMDLALLPLLDPVEAARAAGIAGSADLGRFVVGAWLLRVAVGAATGTDPARSPSSGPAPTAAGRTGGRSCTART